jgi:hypothetical protein
MLIHEEREEKTQKPFLHQETISSLGTRHEKITIFALGRNGVISTSSGTACARRPPREGHDKSSHARSLVARRPPRLTSSLAGRRASPARSSVATFVGALASSSHLARSLAATASAGEPVDPSRLAQPSTPRLMP